jgi:hypothetical protein
MCKHFGPAARQARAERAGVPVDETEVDFLALLGDPVVSDMSLRWSGDFAGSPRGIREPKKRGVLNEARMAEVTRAVLFLYSQNAAFY